MPSTWLRLVLVAIAGWVVLFPLPATSQSGTDAFSAVSRGTGSGNVSLWCPVTNYSIHADRNVSLAAPGFSLAAGDALAVSYEFRVYATNLSPLSVRVYTPTFTAIFPLANAPAHRVTFPPRSFILNNMSWTSGAAVAINRTLTSPLTFSTTARPYFYSARIAIMAAAPYGSLTLEFRWNWTTYSAQNGTKVASPWSAFTTKGGTPSVFDPSPYVTVASTDNRNVTIGQTFGIHLLGAVAHTRFFLEIENASNGHVFRSNYTYAGPSNATPLLSQIQILRANGSLSPVTILEHVRNNCMDLLYSLTLHAVYAPVVNVTFRVLPSVCGPVVFNGTAYTNDTRLGFVPSSHQFNLTVGACAGHSFLSWKTTGGFTVRSLTANPTRGWISAPGIVVARFS